MAKIVIDGREIEAPEGAPLLDVCRQNGIYVSSLCYIEGLAPYAGCRMCLVEIEGARGLQLSCNSRVAEGMVVRTQTDEVKNTRRAVLSLILGNHSDRCLTCHRTEHCRPGDICLRDDVVTHRCITCSKNYRCELQTTCELVGMAEYEPWHAEERSYYGVRAQPPADRANPFLEFDPQMCILCARCVRACDDIRHTTAITLADRGYESHIAFGAGGRVDESNCDFCGACIDVCPTATLMEHPNKWVARPDRWVPTTCNSCSVGCSLHLGVKDGRGVIVKPGESNPFSGNQICVRGRYHYDAVEATDYPTRALVRRGENLVPAPWAEAVAQAASRLKEIARRDGGSAIGFLGSPLVPLEENLVLARVAAGLDSPNLDYTNGDVAAAVADALTASFGSEALPASLTRLPVSDLVVAVADDLEQTHNVASMRAKDAVVRRGARLLVIGARGGELDDFATLSIRCAPGFQGAVVGAISRRVASARGVPGVPTWPESVEGIDDEVLEEAAALVAGLEGNNASFLYAMPHFGASAAGAAVAALANLAIVTIGAAEAAERLFVLPHEANVWGLRDAGVKPGGDGLDFAGMAIAARQGRLKALVVAGDNPMFFASDKAGTRGALESLELLVVIDGLMTDTARLAHVFLPTGHQYSHDGTMVAADRFIGRSRSAVALAGDQHGAYETLAALAKATGVEVPGTVEEAAGRLTAALPGYRDALFDLLGNGARQAIGPLTGTLRELPTIETAEPGDITALTLRTLFTSYEGAAIHSAEADKLHREEKVLLSAGTAARLGVGEGETLSLAAGETELVAPAGFSEEIPDGVVFVPLHIQGGLGAAFATGVEVRVRALAPA